MPQLTIEVSKLQERLKKALEQKKALERNHDRLIGIIACLQDLIDEAEGKNQQPQESNT